MLSLLLLAGGAGAAEPVDQPLPPDAAALAFQLPEGFRAQLVAAEPDLVQPISFCLDDRGRMYVAEAQNYGEWQATGTDRVLILEDTDHNGTAEKRTVFYEGFNYITGIEVGFGGVWVISPPGLYFIPDRNGDDRPDAEPELVLDGFGYKESRHNLANGFTWGPDGWLYAGHGRTSPSDVGPPGTPAEQRIHCDGGVYRIHPTRRVFENFADGTTNPWGVDFDEVGECFVSNCVNPHLFHVLQGGHYEPWRNRPSSRYAYERIATIADHLHYFTGEVQVNKTLGDAPQTPQTLMRGGPETALLGGGHAHCGTLIYLGSNFPAEYRNSVLMCNVHGRRINRDILEPHGSGYVAHHGPDFAQSGDPWFMGVTLKSGPEGGVLVSDWSDTGECHTYKPQRQTGRMFRITYGETKLEEVNLAALSDIELVRLQLHPNEWHARHSRRLLQERAARDDGLTPEVHAALRHQLQHGETVPLRLRGLWALWVTDGLDEVQLAALLHDRAAPVRSWAIRLLCEQESPAESIRQHFAELAAHDPAPTVRLALASALQRLPLEQRWPIITPLLAHAEDIDDQNLSLMYWYALEPLVASDKARGLKLLPKVALPQVRKFVSRRAIDR